MKKTLVEKAKKIKLIATDIDGVWTDSKMYYGVDGLLMKSFSIRLAYFQSPYSILRSPLWFVALVIKLLMKL